MREIGSIIKQLEQQRAAIERAISALREVSQVPSETAGPVRQKSAPKKRRMSPEGRKRIGDAARRRWAALKASKEQEEGSGKRRSGRKANPTTE